MRGLLAALGIAAGFAVARALDALWVLWWYAGDRALGFPAQAGLDAVGLLGAGAVAGWLAASLAGRAASGIGLWTGLLVLGATGVDLLLGIANAPWWHEAVTALVMVPAIMLAGGARPPRRHRRARA